MILGHRCWSCRSLPLPPIHHRGRGCPGPPEPELTIPLRPPQRPQQQSHHRQTRFHIRNGPGRGREVHSVPKTVTVVVINGDDIISEVIHGL